MKTFIPSILAISGHDPTGGAGVQADIETITACGGKAVTLITCLTSQNTKKFEKYYPLNERIFAKQSKLLLSENSLDAIKIGSIGSVPIIKETYRLLKKSETKKIILDPVIYPTAGGKLLDEKMLKSSIKLLFPNVFLLTPNKEEVLEITCEKDVFRGIAKLFALGVKNILLKDFNPNKEKIFNRLYSDEKTYQEWEIRRIPGNYHGTGCTLSSAIATFFSKNNNIIESVNLAQNFVVHAIQNSSKLGRGNRFLKR